MTTAQHKPKIALMTYAIDGRRAKGTAVVARKNVEALLARRDEFDLTFIHYEKSDDEIYSHGVREVIFPTFRFSLFNRRLIRQIYYFLTTTDRYDIIHWFQPRLYPFFFTAPAKHLFVTMHGAGDMTPDNKWILSRKMFNWSIRLSRRAIRVAIAGSEYSRKDLIKYYRFNPDQVRVVNNGADETYVRADDARIRAVREKYDLPEKFFLGVGRLIPQKNVLRTLQAFEDVQPQIKDPHMHFVNLGTAGPERPHIDAFLEKSPVANRIHLVKYVEQDDLPAVYSAAYALVFPLLNEGFGLPAVEAMACGTPAIISETAAPEITNDDVVLVDALDVNSIASAMIAIANDATLHARLKSAGMAKAAQFTWGRSGEKIVLLYNEVLHA